MRTRSRDEPLVRTNSQHGRNKEKALQQKSLQSLIFTQSGRRDLNPRPPEPHSGALPDCATSRRLSIDCLNRTYPFPAWSSPSSVE